MATISSTSAIQAATQQGWQQLKLQQAQRNADRAEQEARSLRAAAADAQRSADSAQENARALSVQSGQAQDNAGRARQGLAVIKSVSDTGTRLTGAYEKIAESQAQAALATQAPAIPATQTPPAAATPETKAPGTPVVNTQGQTTGTVINTTA
jgi:seryl-tRNA synthetase